MCINYKIIRSDKRKTIALQIKNNEVIVRAPKRVSHAYIQLLINNKTSWIQDKLAAQQQNIISHPTYLPNTNILINGLEKVLRIHYQKSKVINPVNIHNNEVKLTLSTFVEKKIQ